MAYALRARPIHMPQEIAGRFSWFNSRFERQKTVVEQPFVQMNAALEAVESVVGESDEQRLVVAVFERLADDRVAATIRIVNNVGEVRSRRSAAVGRMIGLAESPEEMLDPVGRIEQAVKEPRSKRLQLVQHHRLAITPGDRALIEKRLFGDSLVVQARRDPRPSRSCDKGRCAQPDLRRTREDR